MAKGGRREGAGRPKGAKTKRIRVADTELTVTESGRPLKNARHEAFAQGIASGLNQDQALASAGYSGYRGTSNNLMRNPMILNRIASIQSKAASKVAVTLEKWTESLAKIADTDIGDPTWAAKMDAFEKLAKRFGWYAPERHEHAVQVARIEHVIVGRDPPAIDVTPNDINKVDGE